MKPWILILQKQLWREGDFLSLRNYVAVVIDKSGKQKSRFNSVEKQI